MIAAKHESNVCVQVFLSLLFATWGISQAQVRFPEVANGSKAVARVFRGVAHLVSHHETHIPVAPLDACG